MSPSYNAKDLLGDLSGWMATFAEENQFAPTRRGRLLLAMLMLAGVASLLDEDNPSPELRKALTSYFSSLLGKKANTDKFFHDLLGVRFGAEADFTVSLDAAVN